MTPKEVEEKQQGGAIIHNEVQQNGGGSEGSGVGIIDKFYNNDSEDSDEHVVDTTGETHVNLYCTAQRNI